MVYWWNKLKFADLAAVGRYLAQVPYFAEYSEYCRLRSMGLRRPGLDALDRFVAELTRWETARQRQFAHWVARVSTRFQSPDDLSPHPLTTCLVAICEQWGAETEDARPFLCVGIIKFDLEAFAEALRRDPSQDFARRRLLEHCVRALNWAAEDLPDEFFGVPEEVLADSYYGIALAEGFVDAKAHEDLIDVFFTLRRMTMEWLQRERAKGRQSYWSPYIRIQREKARRKEEGFE